VIPPESTRASIGVRRLVEADAPAYRQVRLEALTSHPEAFGSSWEDEADQPLAWFEGRLAGSAVFGGFLGGPFLSGVAGLRVQDRAKQRHKAVLWGMFVRPGARGSGLAQALVGAVVEHGKGVVDEILLTVVTSNHAAVRLYTAAGFTAYGTERRALKIGERYYDEMLMALRFR
jgi:RimJ/RimL family protein N-acetyltransferase